MSAFQIFKNNSRTNANNRFHDTPIIQYARVIKVIDIQTVIAEAVVQTALSREVYTVTLLNLSSALMEINVYPKLDDTVLIFFVQRHDPRMFSEKTVRNPEATGYNQFSGVGILVSTVKNFADTVASFYENDGKPAADINFGAVLDATFTNAVAINFCRAVFDSADERLISLCFGQGRPFMQRFLSTVTREYGFWKDSEGELIPLDAAVVERYSEYAPIIKDIQGTQQIDIGLGADKDGNPVETDASVYEVVHGKSPVVRDIRSPLSIIVGIGNDESEDAEEQRDAPVNLEVGENADITVNSKSGFVAKFKKILDILFEDTITVISKKEITVKSDSTSLLEIGNTIATLGEMISEFIDLVTDLNDLVTDLDTVGSPASHATGPVAKPQLIALNGKLTVFKTKWEKVFK